MWREAVLLAVGCVLFINMGLSEAIQEALCVRSKFLSCPKCLCFWLTLAFLLFSGCRVIAALGASFLFSYAALWADLGLTMLNKKYNELNEKLSAYKKAKAHPCKKRRRSAKTE